jgi:hypothetical protein
MIFVIGDLTLDGVNIYGRLDTILLPNNPKRVMVKAMARQSLYVISVGQVDSLKRVNEAKE